MAKIKIKGIEFKFNETDTLTIPPIPIGYLEQLQGRMSEVTGDALDPKQVTTVIDTLHIALSRNYPEMTREEVGNLVDISNMFEVFECAMDVSGMKRKGLQPGEVLGN